MSVNDEATNTENKFGNKISSEVKKQNKWMFLALNPDEVACGEESHKTTCKTATEVRDMYPLLF